MIHRNLVGLIVLSVLRLTPCSLSVESVPPILKPSDVVKMPSVLWKERTLQEPGKWFSIPHSGIARVKVSEAVQVIDRGTAAYKNKLVWDKLTLVISIQFGEANQGWSLFQFHKDRRDSYLYQSHATDYTNSSYGLAFHKNGELRLVKMKDRQSVKELLKIPTGLDFTQRQEITLEWIQDDSGKAKLCIYLQHPKEAYMYQGELQRDEMKEGGFISVGNFDFQMVTTLYEIRFWGKEEETNLGQTPPPVYMLEYFKERAKRLIHWRYNEGCSNIYQVQIRDENRNLLAQVNYPLDRWELKGDVPARKLYVTPINIDGNEGKTKTVVLKDSATSLAAKRLERVVIRRTPPQASFYLQESNRWFPIKGFNYIRLRYGDHATFEAKTQTSPAHYDAYDAETLFRTLKRTGYTSVRVFIIGRTSVNPGIAGDYFQTQGLYKPYLENVLDFLRRARKSGIYVLPSFGDGELPRNQYYRDMVKNLPSGKNAIYLTRGGIEAKKHYVSSFLQYIKDSDPELLTILLGVQMQNELHLGSDEWPFNQTKETIMGPDGKSYDMADREQRQALMDNGLNVYHNTLVKAIKKIDPELLVTEGVFTLRAVGKDPNTHTGLWPGEHPHPRVPPTAVVLGRSDLDFLDIHFYHTRKQESIAEAFSQDMKTMRLDTAEMQEILKSKPVILGEFGSFKHIDATFKQAANHILQTRDIALQNHFAGFLMWTFDAFEQRNLYHAIEDDGEFLKKFSTY